MLDTVIPKSDQLNFDDFLGKDSMVIKITKVKVDKSQAQSVSIFYENDNGKPYKPSKGMRVAIIKCWGDAKENYIGRSLRLFGNPKVRWQGKEQGGIQISEASHIASDVNFMLTVSRGIKVPYTVKPLIVDDFFDLEGSKEVLRKCLTIEALGVCFKELIKKTVKDSKEFTELVAVKDEMKTKLERK